MRPSSFRSRMLATDVVAVLGSAHAHAAQAGEEALVFTGVLTIFIIALTFFLILVSEKDRRAMGSALMRMRTLFFRGKSERPPTLDQDFDGIHELDNRIPPWFTVLFGATILFAAIYLLDYHVLQSSKLPAGEYQDEVSAAELQRRIIMAKEGQIDESQITALTNTDALKRGEENFKKYCISCHGAQGQGIVGPNLTDDYWIHGGGVKNVYTTIKQGVPAKGMISWQLVFTPKQIQELASYVLSLRGTHPAGAKKPEGTLETAPDAPPAAPGAKPL
jgi:cytochrome c oxidase cbb3-type subunit III